MIDYQKIVDDLRNCVSYLGSTSGEVVERILGEYKDACLKTNERLRQCESLLKRGLRSEAIQLCEIEPNLIDVVATLDFPDRPDAAAALRQLRLALPPLDVEIAAQLNEAYAEQQPLESLLGKHRYLALASSPLRDRLKVLRKIAEVDTMNPIWLEDIGIYEQERFKEIRGEADLAIRQRDQAGAGALLRELKKQNWRQLPPEALVRSLEKALETLNRSLAREELETLERELNSAFGAFDVNQARTLRERWYAAKEICRLDENDILAVRAAPALDWLMEQDRREVAEQAYNDSVARLEVGLETAPVTKLERDQLETLYHAATRHGFGIEHTLESRYQSRIDAWELSATRRARLTIVLGTAAIVLIGLGIAWGVQYQTQSKRMAAIRGSLQQYLTAVRSDPDKLTEAESYVAKQCVPNPDVAADPAVTSLMSELAAESKKEQDRATLFRHTFEQVQARGPQSPDRPALVRATELARTDAEKTSVALFESEISRTQRETQNKIDDAFHIAVDELTTALVAVEKIGFADLDRLEREIQRLQSDVLAVQTKHSSITSVLKAKLTPISTRLSTLRTASDRIRAENSALDTIRRAAGDPTRLPAALEKFAREHLNNPRSGDFQKAATEALQWNLVDTWNHDVAAAFTESDPMKAAEALRAAAETHSRLPKAALLAERAVYLLPIASRKEANGIPKVQTLRDIFESPILQQAFTLKIKDDKSGSYLLYYLKDKDRLTIGSPTYKVQYLADFSGSTEKNTLVSPDKVLGTPTEAPHCKMSADLKATLTNIKDGKTSWELGFAELIRIAHSSTGGEPLLQITLLQQFVKTGREGSEALRRALEEDWKLLEKPKADLYANWLDPKDEAARQASSTAGQELRGLFDIVRHAAAAGPMAEEAVSRLADEVHYDFFGCLLKNPDGVWWCETGGNDVSKRTGVLLTLLPDAPIGSLLIPVGTIADGKIKLESQNQAQLLEGRAVWLERSTKHPLN